MTTGLLKLFFGILVAVLPLIAQPVEKEATYSIPYVKNIVLDGQIADWGTSGFYVSTLSDMSGKPNVSATCDAAIRIGWDSIGLLVLVTITDNDPVEFNDTNYLWQGDAVEFFMADTIGAPDFFQLIVTPGIDGKHKLRIHGYDNRQNKAFKNAPLKIDAATKATSIGYIMEVRIPWANLAINPFIGRECAFTVQADAYSKGDRFIGKLGWFPQPGAYWNSAMMMRIRLADQPDKAVKIVTYAQYENFRRVVVTAVGTKDMVGKTVTVKNGGQIVGTALYQLDQNTRAKAQIVLPLPKDSTKDDTLLMLTESERLNSVIVPNLKNELENAINANPVIFPISVFKGQTFPTGNFVDTLLAQDCLGRYTIETTFYDAQLKKVIQPTTPGRYGALVKVRRADGKIKTYSYSLFKLGTGFKWYIADTGITLEYPKMQGAESSFIKRHANVVAALFSDVNARPNHFSDDTAATLAWLYEMSSQPNPGTLRTDAESANLRWWIQLRQKVGELIPYEYCTFEPEGYKADSTRRYPLLIVLHGRGGQHSSFKEHCDAAAKRYLTSKAKSEFPSIIIYPRCVSQQYDGSSWSPQKLNILMKDVLAKYRVTKERVYLTGVSMGGNGTWRFATEYPQYFAAIAPICGWGDSSDVRQLKKMPIWVFHGEKDNTVPTNETYDMVNAFKRLNQPIKVTIIPDADHDISDRVMQDPEYLSWMFKQKRAKRAKVDF